MISPFDLRCEYTVDPVGIDARQPRFSWLLRADERGQKQSGYQILVASSESDLRAGVGSLPDAKCAQGMRSAMGIRWDSGRVTSARAANVVYGGAALSSDERRWWTVRVWDQEGRASGQTAPAVFSMGLLEASDWQGGWIGAADGSVSAPLLRRAFTLDRPVRRATLHMSGLG